jgi:argininosuccinate lyase
MPDLWSGRLPGGLDPEVRAFSSSLNVDWRLASYDIRGSLAHVEMLRTVGLLTDAEAGQISGGLRQLLAEVAEGATPWNPEAEDVHSAVEEELTQRIGAVAGKLHTGRSRNDQVAVDLHLYTRDAVTRTAAQVGRLAAALLEQAGDHEDTVLPGYTHMQRAQPVPLAHHLLAYVWMLSRDRERLLFAYQEADRSPLGAGALAGSTLPLDPELSRRSLGLARLYENSLDAVSDRDFLLDFLGAAAQIMLHLSRLAEELVLWSTREFGFVSLQEGWATGSSMMPQKKNPDVAELLRGRAGRTLADYVGLATVMKGLPLSYNRDLQEDKAYVFHAADTVTAALSAMAGLVSHLDFVGPRMAASLTAELLATDEAEALVRQGTPFREAHGTVGARYRDVDEAPVASDGAIRQSLRDRDRAMGPGPQSVREQIERARAISWTIDSASD